MLMLGSFSTVQKNCPGAGPSLVIQVEQDVMTESEAVKLAFFNVLLEFSEIWSR